MVMMNTSTTPTAFRLRLTRTLIKLMLAWSVVYNSVPLCIVSNDEAKVKDALQQSDYKTFLDAIEEIYKTIVDTGTWEPCDAIKNGEKCCLLTSCSN